MKLTLQVTERDKRMLALLVLVIFLASFWQFLFKDTLTEYLSLGNQIHIYESMMDDNANYETQAEYFKMILSQNQAEADLLISGYFRALPVEFYIDVVLRQANGNLNLHAAGFNTAVHSALGFAPALPPLPVGPLASAALDYQGITGISTPPINTAISSTAPLAITEVLFSFSEATYNDMATFMENIENLPTKIVIRNMSVSSKAGSLNGTFTIVFPGVYEMSGDVSAFPTPANPGAGSSDAFNYTIP